MTNKICTKCKIEKPIENFYKYKNKRNGYRPDCRDCRNKWSREYGKKMEVKKRRNEKGDRWAQKNLKSWRGYIPEETNCEVCGALIIFSSKDVKTAIHFDHKSEDCLIKNSPTQWLMKHAFNEENKKLWEACGFGMLCGICNRGIPTRNRKEWLEKIAKYIKNENPF